MAASVGGQLLASSRTVFPADRRPNPTTEGAAEGAVLTTLGSARAAMLVQCTGAAPALRLHCYEAMAKSAQPGPRNSENIILPGRDRTGMPSCCERPLYCCTL